MSRSLMLCGLFLLLSMPTLSAEQEVTLKSGTRLIGEVSFQGESLEVTIGKSKMTIPLDNVESIGPVGTNTQQTPEKLLLRALESRLSFGTGEAALGLLSEAARLAPDDPRIAYWYATSLVDAGQGKAAQEVFEAHRKEIMQLYPGQVDQLIQQLSQRSKRENLPPQLLARINQIDSTLKQGESRGDKNPIYICFRVRDEQGKPLPQRAIRVSSKGGSGDIEEFSDGYYLCRITRIRSDFDYACRLMVDWPGFKSAEMGLPVLPDQVADGGELVVTRLREDSKVTLRFRVSDAEGHPLHGVAATVYPETGRNDSGFRQSEKTDERGQVEFSVFPMKYRLMFQSPGYVYQMMSLDLEQEPRRDYQVTLVHQIQGKIRIVWMMTSEEPEKNITKGDTTISIGGGQNYQDEMSNYFRAHQVGDRVLMQMGLPYGSGNANWIRQVHPSAAVKSESEEATARRFASLDLDSIGDNRDKYDRVNIDPTFPRSSQNNLTVALKQGDLYVGQFEGRNPRSPRPSTMSFKVLVQQLDTMPTSE